MKVNFEQPPYSALAPHLRPWFEQIVADPDLSPTSRLWRIPLPTGSTIDDACAVSECLRTLFPEQAAAANALCTPVGAEFVL